MAEKPLLHVRPSVVVFTLADKEIHGDVLADGLRDELLAVYVQANALHAVLDFRQVTYLSSAGIRPLLSLNRQVHGRGGRLVLCGLTPTVEEILSVTRLISTRGTGPAAFEVQPDVPAAVASLYRNGGEAAPKRYFFSTLTLTGSLASVTLPKPFSSGLVPVGGGLIEVLKRAVIVYSPGAAQ
jgi:anti-anti-sigma factor